MRCSYLHNHFINWYTLHMFCTRSPDRQGHFISNEFFFLSYILCNYLHKRKHTRTNSATPSIKFQRQRILYLFPKDATAIGSCCAFVDDLLVR